MTHDPNHPASDHDPASAADPAAETPETQADAQPAADSPADPPVDDAERRIAALEDDIAKLRYALAESDNARKRAQREAEDHAKYAVAKFARELLTVADNLDRAIAAVPDQAPEEHPALHGLLGGVSGTARELRHAFEKAGIQKLEAMGQPFDPNHHEAMFEAPHPSAQPGTVIEVLQDGYILHDRLLRPARVGVARATEGGGPGGGLDETV